MTESYTLPWHLTGNTECLLSGRDTGGRSEGLAEFLAGPASPLTSVGANGSVPQLVGVLRLISNLSRFRKAFPWPSGALGDLDVRLVRMPDEFPHELILTPDVLYLPWPLFWKLPAAASDPLDDLDLKIPDLPEEVLAGHHLKLSATMDAADWCAECEHDATLQRVQTTGPSIRQRVIDRAADNGQTYSLGEPFDVIGHPTRWIGKTDITYDPKAGFVVHVGLERTWPTALLPDEDGLKGIDLDFTTPHQPCGAFTGVSREHAPGGCS